MESLRHIVDGKIDFEGQRLADRIYQEILVLVSALGLFLGYLLQSLQLSLIVFTLALVVALVVCVPPWPMYNKYHIDWLPARPKEGQGAEAASSSSSGGGGGGGGEKLGQSSAKEAGDKGL